MRLFSARAMRGCAMRESDVPLVLMVVTVIGFLIYWAIQ